MTTVVWCGDGRTPPPTGSDASIVVIDGLCQNLGRLAEWVNDDENELVLVVHRDATDPGAVQAAVRRVGFDPLRVGVLVLDTVGSRRDLGAALAGTIARSGAALPVRPEQVKLVPPDRTTRRGFLSLGKPRYVSTPGVSHDLCHASEGCRACITACPTNALGWDRGTVTHDVNACVACGICLTTCPASAIGNPTVSPVAIEDEIRAVVTTHPGPIGIRFRCRDATVPGEPGWYQLEVPCTAMLTPGWVLAPVLAGAAKVDVVTCTAGGCPLGNDQRTVAVLADTVNLASDLGLRLDGSATAVPATLEARGLLSPGATGRVIDLLTSRASGLHLALPASDIGLVTIDPTTCTACERCTAACPSGALLSDKGDDGVTISFDPGPCTGCSACVVVCPEAERGAITVERTADANRRAEGRLTVRADQTTRCELCGRPVAPTAMLERIAQMLGEDAARVMPAIARRCLDCRGR